MMLREGARPRSRPRLQISLRPGRGPRPFPCPAEWSSGGSGLRRGEIAAPEGEVRRESDTHLNKNQEQTSIELPSPPTKTLDKGGSGLGEGMGGLPCKHHGRGEQRGSTERLAVPAASHRAADVALFGSFCLGVYTVGLFNKGSVARGFRHHRLILACTTKTNSHAPKSGSHSRWTTYPRRSPSPLRPLPTSVFLCSWVALLAGVQRVLPARQGTRGRHAEFFWRECTEACGHRFVSSSCHPSVARGAVWS